MHMKIAIDHYVSADVAGMIKGQVIDAVDKMIASSNDQSHGGSKGKSKDDPEVEHGDKLVDLCDRIIQIAVDNLLCKHPHSFLHIA